MDLDLIRRLLAGESAVEIAQQCGLHSGTVVDRAIRWLTKQPWYSSAEYIKELQKPGSGKLRAARELFRRHEVVMVAVAETEFESDLATLEQIRRAHVNCHGDCLFLLKFIDRLWKEYSRSVSAGGTNG